MDFRRKSVENALKTKYCLSYNRPKDKENLLYC